MKWKDFVAGTAVFNDMRQLIVYMEKWWSFLIRGIPATLFGVMAILLSGITIGVMVILLSIPRCRRLISFSVS